MGWGLPRQPRCGALRRGSWGCTPRAGALQIAPAWQVSGHMPSPFAARKNNRARRASAHLLGLDEESPLLHVQARVARNRRHCTHRHALRTPRHSDGGGRKVWQVEPADAAPARHHEGTPPLARPASATAPTQGPDTLRAPRRPLPFRGRGKGEGGRGGALLAAARGRKVHPTRRRRCTPTRAARVPISPRRRGATRHRARRWGRT